MSDNYEIKFEIFKSGLIQMVDEKISQFYKELVTVPVASPFDCNGSYAEQISSPQPSEREMLVKDKANVSLQEKKFVFRVSLLTDLFRSNHIRTIYHFFVAILIVLIVNSMLRDLFDDGTLNLKFDLIRWCFGKLPIVITLWMCMFFVVILIVYPAFHFWSYSNVQCKSMQLFLLIGNIAFYTKLMHCFVDNPKLSLLPSLSKDTFVLSIDTNAILSLNRGRDKSYVAPDAYDWLWLGAYSLYTISMLIIPIRCIIVYDLPIASSLIVVCEQVRFIMKVHAFVRENIPKALKYKATFHANKENNTNSLATTEVPGFSPCPSFDKYLYFLFAPTLVYRDEYPRTEKIDWNEVVSNFLQVVGCLFYVYYLFSHFCVPIFQDFNKDHITLRSFIVTSFSSILPGALCFLLAFYAILHAWHNAFAEMLRFGDRMFYRDWWNSTNFANYYRTWNVIVHDWLFTYVYRDLYLLFGTGSRSGAMISVFWLSAIVHEYIIIVAFRFFYPVLFVEFFIFGVMLLFLTSSNQKQVWNILFWVGMLIGTGLMMCLYSMEWYARVNCPPTYNNLVDHLVPRSWTCLTGSSDVKLRSSP